MFNKLSFGVSSLLDSYNKSSVGIKLVVVSFLGFWSIVVMLWLGYDGDVEKFIGFAIGMVIIIFVSGGIGFMVGVSVVDLPPMEYRVVNDASGHTTPASSLAYARGVHEVRGNDGTPCHIECRIMQEWVIIE